MLSIVFHLLLTAGVIWYHKARDYKVHALTLTVGWYAVSAALVFIGMAALTGDWLSGMLVQGMVVGLFYAPAVFITLRWAERRKAGLGSTFGFFMLMAVVATAIASVVLARAEIVKGLSAI